MELILPLVDDFEVTGSGDNPVWQKAPWQSLSRVGAGGCNYATRAKAVYSVKGIYYLFDCEDRVLTCALNRDMADLYTEDVVEVFLWPDEAVPVYLEYELSPLNYELPLMVPNSKGAFYGWLPFHYTGGRCARHQTTIRGGEKKSMATVAGYNAEFFIPFELVVGLSNNPPKPGMRWRANMYRIDYDVLPQSHWAWCKDAGANFHHINGFGAFLFGE